MTENEAIKSIKSGICNEIGTAKYCHDNCMHGVENCAYSMAIQALEEIQQYRAIGTIEELKALKEKNVAKKPNKVDRKRDEDGFLYKIGECPCCGKLVTDGRECCDCGQKLDWE